MSLILTQKKNNTNIHKFNPYQIKSQMQQLTHNPTEHISKIISGNQTNIYDINIQRQEHNKGIIIANILKDKMNSQQKTNAQWLVTTIKAILKIPIQKFEKPIFLFSKTNEASVRNRNILASFKGDLRAANSAQKDSPVNYG